MREWTALYYPNIEPPIAWLRSAALLFNKITSFVPRESDEHLSEELLRFCEKTDAWQPYRPDHQTAELVGPSLERLDAAFAELPEDRKSRSNHLELRLAGGCIENRVFLHGSKMSAPIRDLLRRHRLMLPKSLADALMPGDWWLVDERASDLLLAQIADNLAARQGWASVTDDRHCHAFLSVDSARDSAVIQGRLARLVISELIPESIVDLSIESYI